MGERSKGDVAYYECSEKVNPILVEFLKQ